MDDRMLAVRGFVDRVGWGVADIALIAGDASNRRYFRLTNGDARAILMDAPPETGEDIAQFVKVAEFLLDQGLSAPQVMAKDFAAGFLLLEDLGDDLFARLIEDDQKMESGLYEAAIDVLVALHKAPLPDLPRFDAVTMAEQAALVFDWYQMGATGQSDARQRSEFVARMTEALAPMALDPQVVILRDYHAENLIWLPSREGVARVGLLDFQDAKLCHASYDVVSVLQDARRDVPVEVEAACIARYVDATGAEPEQFMRVYNAIAAQRNLRIVGVFARLSMAGGKAHYVDYIPRVWAYLVRTLEGPLRDFVLGALPEPTPKCLNLLKDQCGTRLFQ